MSLNCSIHLITGGAGFIGSNLISELINKGDYVICVDNFLTGNKENISKWLKHPKFTLINQTILDDLKLKVNYIWHLACPPSPKYYYQNPIETSKIIYLGTLNLLELAKNNNAKFLFASSSEIYGHSKIIPMHEELCGEVLTLSKRSCYSEAKRLGETLCFDYQRKFGLNIKIARIFNTYGPGMSLNDGRVINTFVVNALNNKSIMINGDGKQTRSFCYVDDIIEGILKLMFSKFDGVFNLGYPEEITILELAETILNKLNSNSDIVFNKIDKDEPLRRKPSINKARKFLYWEPRVNLDNGLNKTIHFFNSLIHKNNIFNKKNN